MKKRFHLFLLLFLLPLLAYSQNDYHKHISHTGYQNYTSFGLLPGSSENEKEMPFSLIMDNNFAFLGHFSVGITSGIEFIYETLIPLAVNTKLLLPLKYKTFYAGGYYGKSYPLKDPEYLMNTGYYYVNRELSANGGVLTGGEIGIILPVSGGSDFFMAIGYRYHELNYDYTDHRGNVNTTVYYNRLNVKLGIALY